MTQTKTLIKQSFIKLYAQYGYHKLSIRQLCQDVPIARTTFYTYYDNLSQVLEDIEDELINGILEIIEDIRNSNPENLEFSLLFDKIYPYLNSQHPLLKSLLVVEPDYQLMQKWKAAIKYHLNISFPDKKNIPNWALLSEMIASSILSAYVYWLENPNTIAMETLKQQLSRFLCIIPKIF